jgi:C_GCAxxG_C_C family probable redox protein
MQEEFELDPSVNWAGIGFMGGISGCQTAPCGAISAAVVALGFIKGKGATDKQTTKQARADTRNAAEGLYKGFQEKFEGTECLSLTGKDFSVPGQFEQFVKEGGFQDKCDKYVEFVVRELCQHKE